MVRRHFLTVGRTQTSPFASSAPLRGFALTDQKGAPPDMEETEALLRALRDAGAQQDAAVFGWLPDGRVAVIARANNEFVFALRATDPRKSNRRIRIEPRAGHISEIRCPLSDDQLRTILIRLLRGVDLNAALDESIRRADERERARAQVVREATWVTTQDAS